MLNYFERIDLYRRKNYFQINGLTLDVYGPTLPQWSQNLDVVMDILTYVHGINIADEFDILSVRITGSDASEQTLADLNQTMATANQVLSEKLGKAEVWETVKQDGAPSRLFLAITIETSKSKINEKKQPATRKSKTVRDIPADPEPV
jgi:hypothetical protein